MCLTLVVTTIIATLVLLNWPAFPGFLRVSLVPKKCMFGNHCLQNAYHPGYTMDTIPAAFISTTALKGHCSL